MGLFCEYYFCMHLAKTRVTGQRIEVIKLENIKKGKKQSRAQRDYIIEDKTKINRPKSYKDGPSKGSCDVPRQNSRHSHSEPA